MGRTKGMDNREKTWRGVQAASLSLIPGLGHLFLDEKRGYWLLGVTVSMILIWKFFWRPMELLYLSYAIFSAVDAYSFAKRGHGLM